MRRLPPPARPPLAATIAVLASACALAPAGVAAAARAHPGQSAAGRERRQVARVERYWTPARMRSARPLELVVGKDGSGRTRLGAADPVAGASFAPVATPEEPPYSFSGRIFLRRGKLRAYCSGTAIDSPSRRLVLTAGHCVNSGHEGGRASVWSNYMEFVPAYTGGVAPFGTFVAHRASVRAPLQWTKAGNPDFDLGALLTSPDAQGVEVADAVGGGAAIALGLSRHQEFQTFGYPGESTRMQACRSPYVGDDRLTNRFAGPPTLGIRCHWAPGASGGGWLIDEGTEIDGLTSYLHVNDRSRTYGPYFTEETVGKLTQGL